MSLAGEKSIFSSTTIRGALVVLIPAILSIFGIDLGEDTAGLIGDLMQAGITLVGVAMVIYGRITATKTIAT